MRVLNEKHVYDLSELTSEELQNIWNYLMKKEEAWEGCPFEEMIRHQKKYRLVFGNYGWYWSDIIQPTANAKELFYTLENIQVDCRELTEGQIKQMADVFENAGYKAWDDPNALKKIQDDDDYLRLDWVNDFYINCKSDTKTTITYSKFMELFSNKEENFKKLVEVLNEELTEEAYKESKINIEFNPKNGNNLINEIHSYSYNNSQFKQIANSLADLLEYKNKMYGNSALEPLNIFNNKCKVGQRLDDKLARIKNSNELRKNDICDLIGYLILTCKENNWTNFDEFKD